MNAYAVVSVDPVEREDLFVSVRRRALGDEAASRHVHRWQYCESDGETHALLLRAEGDGVSDIVGWTAVQERCIEVDGVSRRAGLLFNLAVSAEHRTARPALMLQRAAREVARAHFELSYGYPNHAALGGFLRAGYRVLGEVRRYACVLGRHGDKLSKLGLSPRLAAVAGSVPDVVSPLVRRLAWLRWSRRYAFECPALPDERFDALWQRTASTRKVMVRRDAAFLRWRLLEHPEEPFTLGALLDRSTGAVVGYAAMRVSGEQAHLADLFTEDEDALGALVDATLAALCQSGAAVVDISYLGPRKTVAVLRLRGFQPREVVRTAIVDPGGLGGCLLDPERWHLTNIDGDL